MKAYVAFTKKEFCECYRTYKLLIMLVVFILIGMISPIVAKIMPELIGSFMPEGIEITISEPTALDSWAQFFKNIPQMGLIILVIMFGGILANEYNRGTLINMLTKGLPRNVVILSKFTMTVSLWTLSYLLCFLVTYAYTRYFWTNDSVPNLFFSVFCMWIFGILLLAISLLGGVFFKSTYANLLLTGGFIVTLMVLNILPHLQKYNPITLSTNNMSLLTTVKEVTDFLPAIIVSFAMIIVAIVSAIIVFNKKQV